MDLNHVGIINLNEEHAELFYGEVLGFQKTRDFNLPVELSEQLFDQSREIKILVFERDGVKLEVFICPEYKQDLQPDFSHLGLYIDNLDELLKKSEQSGVEHIMGKTTGKIVHFIKDFSGNLIEIKQK
jgi:methylmalonyl-CoA/ethylmalonyl-CoA epimerase